MITVGEYTDLFLTIIAGLGIVFEMPILVFFLALMGIVSAGWMWRNLRYSILVIFIIAAVITPTTDIMNMCIFAAPMIVLYLVSIAIAWFVHPTQRRKRAEKAGAADRVGSFVTTSAEVPSPRRSCGGSAVKRGIRSCLELPADNYQLLVRCSLSPSNH